MRKLTENEWNTFERYLYEEEKSEHTIDKYRHDVHAFSRYVRGKSLTKELVLTYKRELCEKYAPRSVNSMLSALNSLFDFLEWTDLKVKTLKIQRPIFAERDTELRKSEYDRLLDVAKQRKNDRLYYLIQTLGATGIRVSELRHITVEAVHLGRAVIHCKGKIRKILLPEALCKMLAKYARTQKLQKGAVFVTAHGRPLDRSSIWKMLKGLCGEAGVSPKRCFRTTCDTCLQEPIMPCKRISCGWRIF